MAQRIEVTNFASDMKSKVRMKRLQRDGFPVKNLQSVDVFTVDGTSTEESEALRVMLVNPITQMSSINFPVRADPFDYAVEIGFLPGVTDNVGNTARQMIEDTTKRNFSGQTVYTSQLMLLSGVSRTQAEEIGNSLSNPVIQRFSVKSFSDFQNSNGMGTTVPLVNLRESKEPDIVDVISASESELTEIGKRGIANANGSRRGPLAMRTSYMKSVQNYAKNRGINTTDIELETIAQSWSEHCCHTINADPVDELQEGLYRTYIKGATNEIRRKKGLEDFCVSVFKDNSGAIIFDDNWLITDKVETHNSPSALDPFGGSITGIVGVDRDSLGFGLGAKPCFPWIWFLSCSSFQR